MRSNNDELETLWKQLRESKQVEAEELWIKQQLERKCDILEGREELLSSLLSSYMRVNDLLKSRLTRLRLLATEQEIINRNLREWQPQPEAPSLMKPVEEAAEDPAEMVKTELERQLQMKSAVKRKEQKRSSIAGLRLLFNIICNLMRWSCKLLLLSGILLLLFYVLLQTYATVTTNCRSCTRGMMETMELILRPYLAIKVEGPVPI
ncbi:uncharacterized protein LOC142153189 [Mixophyes fleayi]|uniref:uncharacterized protein LOC142153189 n=1 Tax=Mixophyes fleayi TaxID=3061075 RepID=UPI003F4DAA53